VPARDSLPSVPERLQDAAEWVRPAAFVARPLVPVPCASVSFADVSVKEIAEWACVTETHARLLKAGHRKPSPAVEKLVRLHLAGRVVPASWNAAGWSFVGSRGQEALQGPDALTFQPSEVLALPYLQSELAAHRADQRQYRQDAERAADLRHVLERLESAFLQIGLSVADAQRLLSVDGPGREDDSASQG
jgi:hypothetical protein